MIIRSHEGPDSRDGRIDFDDMVMGYSTDHNKESGKLYTLFSAPDFPQVSTPCFLLLSFILSLNHILWYYKSTEQGKHIR